MFMCFSSSSRTRPSGAKIRRAVAMCPSPARLPGESTVVPQPMLQGVFGIARTTATRGPRISSSWAVVTPAAIETTSVRGERAPAAASSRATSSTCIGLSANTTTSAPATAATLSAPTAMPSCAWSRAAAGAGARRPGEEAPGVMPLDQSAGDRLAHHPQAERWRSSSSSWQPSQASLPPQRRLTTKRS